jgi:hypothetical protein
MGSYKHVIELEFTFSENQLGPLDPLDTHIIVGLGSYSNDSPSW